jgi:hypothetical protein
MSSCLIEIKRLPTHQSLASSIEEQSLSANFESSTILRGTAYATRTISPTQQDPRIEHYFRSNDQDRLEMRRKVALRVKTFETVFLVLEWGVRGDVHDSYAAAVDLLAECEGILIGALQYLYLEYPRKGTKQLDLETKLDVLIQGLARAHRLSSESRLRAVTALVSSKSRIVKAAIVDAVSALENKRNKRMIKELLSLFSSSRETDTYIRQYAEDALEDIE